MTKEEIEQEIENLKFLLEFHSQGEFIQDLKEYESHINDILDRLEELREKLKKSVVNKAPLKEGI